MLDLIRDSALEQILRGRVFGIEVFGEGKEGGLPPAVKVVMLHDH
jgi:hypothetical protein